MIDLKSHGTILHDLELISMALGNGKPVEGALHLSDRSIQYANKEYRALLEQAGISCSMSRRANWRYAVVESFFSTL
jgi:transposase InsO family protein